jgi:hypothetical protein
MIHVQPCAEKLCRRASLAYSTAERQFGPFSSIKSPNLGLINLTTVLLSARTTEIGVMGKENKEKGFSASSGSAVLPLRKTPDDVLVCLGLS